MRSDGEADRERRASLGEKTRFVSGIVPASFIRPEPGPAGGEPQGQREEENGRQDPKGFFSIDRRLPVKMGVFSYWYNHKWGDDFVCIRPNRVNNRII